MNVISRPHSRKIQFVCGAAVLFLVGWSSFCVSAQSQYPYTDIGNSELSMNVYHPDPNEGYYRATRFDWSGVVGKLIYNNVEFFGHWLPEHDPLNHESITGPVEAFTPLLYNEAPIGGSFVVIGVGELEKESDDPYRFARPYKIRNGGKWKTKSSSNKITSKHTLKSATGYAYKYIKTIELAKDAPEFVIKHTLMNTGKMQIVTSVYNHNFFVIADELTGPNIVTHLTEPIQAEGRGFGDAIVIDENKMVFTRALESGESVYTSSVSTMEGTPPDYLIFIENKKAGVGVEISCDKPLQKLSYWACQTTACPEPYLAIDLPPGESFSWDINYRFYEVEW